jgi:hypothetical protein
VIGESPIIIEYVAGARLVPSLEARTWDRLCDQYVSDAVQAIVLHTIEQRSDERTAARARDRLDMAYGRRRSAVPAPVPAAVAGGLRPPPLTHRRLRIVRPIANSR